MKHLTGIHGVGYSRARACRATGLSPRTIDRGLSDLVGMRLIARQRGGRGTSAKITVLMTMPEFLAHQVRMAHQVPQNGALSSQNGAPSLALSLKEKDKKKEGPVFANLTDRELEILISMGDAPDEQIWAAIRAERKPAQSEQGARAIIDRERGVA